MNRPSRRLMLVALFIMVALFGVSITSVQAAPPNPVIAPATIDGNMGEWNTTTDFFANMYLAGDSTRTVEAYLYLRYQCTSNTLYALVLPAPGYTILQLPTDSFVKLGNSTTLVNGNSGDDGIAPDFAWISPTGTTVAGWEASAILIPGTYTNLNVHTQVRDPGGNPQTAAVANRSITLTINCSLAAELDYFRAVPQRGSVRVEWATNTEVNNLGFNIYRSQGNGAISTAATRINSALIPSQAQGSSEGAAYMYKDGSVVAGQTYQYWLETVAANGTTHRYGPVTVNY